ncbi:MAG: transporter [Nibricoccus sp.]
MALVIANYSTGDLNFDPTGPIQNAQAEIFSTGAGYVRTLGVLNRSASIALAVAYADGPLEGDVLGEHQQIHRSGLVDPRLRFAINILGGPALSPKEFVSTPQARTTLGASIVVSMPFGEYMPDKLINIGTNRWGFKPELGLRHTIGRCTLEADAGAWLFTDNTDFYGGKTRSQEPIGSFQLHVIYTFKPRCWLAVSTNYYTGGSTSVNNGPSQSLQKNSRFGVTQALPLKKNISLKLGYSRGAFTTAGADFDSYTIALQNVW